MVTVVTGFNKKGLEEYGYKCLESFKKHWPKEVKHISYLEEPDEKVSGLSDEVRYLHEIPDLVHFIGTNMDNRVAAGREPRAGWKQRDIEKGYCYKFDILKFCKQVVYLWDAAQKCNDDYLLWLDGDVLTFEDISESFIRGLIPYDYAASYLGRVNKHSEIGLLAFHLPKAMPIINEYARPIIDGSVFELDEWHSAYLFDEARKKYKDICYDMTPNGRGHVWFQSELGNYMDHLKGDRKAKGVSKERWKK